MRLGTRARDLCRGPRASRTAGARTLGAGRRSSSVRELHAVRCSRWSVRCTPVVAERGSPDRRAMRAAVAVWMVVACRGAGPREATLLAAHETILAHHRTRDWRALAPRDPVIDIGDG